MIKHLFLLLVALLITPFLALPVRADDGIRQTYSKGTILSVDKETQTPTGPGVGYIQELTIKDESGSTHQIALGSEQIPLSKQQTYHAGQTVVLVKEIEPDGTEYISISDEYRLPGLMVLIVAFVVVVLLVAMHRGVLSLLGMGVSLLVLLLFMVPQIIAGGDPIIISLISALVIGSLIIYLGHGFNAKSHVALSCMFATLALVAAISFGMVRLAHLSGVGDENASFLQFSGAGNINLRGLFLGGIILAALSVLDDSVVSQVSVISQLVAVKKHITFKELYARGMEVGKDHISTLVNTLILAYAGASLPLFILFTLNKTVPVWVTLNDPMIAEEIVRTLTGSIGLVLSIPLTTFLASWIFLRKKA